MSKYNHRTGSRGYGNVGIGTTGGNVGVGSTAPAPNPVTHEEETPEPPAPDPSGDEVGIGTSG